MPHLKEKSFVPSKSSRNSVNHCVTGHVFNVLDTMKYNSEVSVVHLSPACKLLLCIYFHFITVKTLRRLLDRRIIENINSIELWNITQSIFMAAVNHLRLCIFPPDWPGAYRTGAMLMLHPFLVLHCATLSQWEGQLQPPEQCCDMWMTAACTHAENSQLSQSSFNLFKRLKWINWNSIQPLQWMQNKGTWHSGKLFTVFHKVQWEKQYHTHLYTKYKATASIGLA